MASHLPVNHPLRPFYRFLALLAGLYVLIFGIIGFSKTHSSALFTQNHSENAWVLGLRTNSGFALISIIAGAIIVVASVMGRNIDRFVNLWGGLFFMIVGMAMLLVLQTNANFLSFSMSNCAASFIIGVVLYSAGLYGKTGTNGEHHGEEKIRHTAEPRESSSLPGTN
jgi:glucan phosphoethanolaminetransferase (alkaline phosphatase superfamily)